MRKLFISYTWIITCELIQESVKKNISWFRFFTVKFCIKISNFEEKVNIIKKNVNYNKKSIILANF